jgi:dihydrofolate reductase
MGLERISCIGGRTLATQLLDAGLVQDVYLTTSARRGGEQNTPMYPKPLDAELVVRKTGTEVEAGVVFEHRYLPRRNSFMNMTVA